MKEDKVLSADKRGRKRTFRHTAFHDRPVLIRRPRITLVSMRLATWLVLAASLALNLAFLVREPEPTAPPPAPIELPAPPPPSPDPAPSPLPPSPFMASAEAGITPRPHAPAEVPLDDRLRSLKSG